ncbi:unnamed protein product [Rotaria magnacalcarata]|uniref:FAD dependent oxidoreductase domain-containing protein n=3 Tax=Rotaria magnacalcarata TaxID=392030 RepID=A0A816JZ52_9BILA|nr:unnamed protein product [Rotaria magnacalcarata]CAF4014254.1 unnamed protein product [Rotaria magnacalcarata]
MTRVCVIGAGVVGLSTALCIKSQYPSLSLTIIADRFLDATTSDGAGGLFRPDDRFVPGVDKSILRNWCQTSFDHFNNLIFSSIGAEAGISQVSGYQLFNDPRPDPSYKDIVYNFRHLTKNELTTFPDHYKYGYFCTTFYVDTRKYMKYLTKQLLEKEVTFTKKKINSLDELVGSYDIALNCTGFGAREICNDNLIRPIRGQMIRVRAPWIKHFYYTDDNCYMIPNHETIVLGGTRQLDDDNTRVDLNDKDGIWQRCLRLCPSLAQAEILWDWAGLRPNREPIRVEIETIKHGNKNLLVVHNYGHGGNGISLSWGTSVDATRHFSSLLPTIDSKNKQVTSKL